jgi:mRNA interferase HigB
MNLVGRNRLDEFCTKHPDARGWIENWLADVETAEWMTPHQLKARYPSASLLGDGLTVFNVKGNDYRLEVRVAYKTATVVVLWIGTHAAYDERNKRR